jgi:hypothetical protein
VIDSLTHLVNYSLSTSCFFKHWKKSVQTPILKKREVRGLDDLRPISILPRTSNVVERVVHNQLAHYLCVHGLFDEFQWGFRKSHSMTTTLLKVSNDLRKSFNRGMISLLLLLDFSKAFDKINNGRLLKKLRLRAFSLSDGVFSWCASYLHDRAQCVSVGRKCSSWLDVDSGVSQGSILGTLLFYLYINDIGGNLNYCRHHLFADDCQIYYSLHPHDIDAAVGTVNEDLMAIQRWALANDLSLNASKTLIFLCDSPHFNHCKTLSYETAFFNEAEMTFSEVVKNLGVLFDESLSGRDQVYLRLRRSFIIFHDSFLRQ